jgi:hypothetical protein
MSPASVEDWLRFLRPIAAAVRNPPTQADAKAKAGALAFALSVPAQTLSERLQREACRRFTFWPSVEELTALVGEDWREQARSRAIASASGANLLPGPATAGEALTHEARTAIVARFRLRWDTEVQPATRNSQARAARPPAQASPLSDGVLLERYRKIAEEGGPTASAARERIRFIEAKIARSAGANHIGV